MNVARTCYGRLRAAAVASVAMDGLASAAPAVLFSCAGARRLAGGLALTAAAFFVTGSIAEEAEAPSSAPEIIGKMHYDGQTYDLTRAHWCEPEDGYEKGTTVPMRVTALDESGDSGVTGLQVDRDRDRPSIQSVNRLGPDGGDMSFEITLTGPLAEDPPLRIEDDVVYIKWSFSSGDLEAEFTLPEAPGFPGYC